MKPKPNQTLKSTLTTFFCQKILKCFNDLQNRNLPVLWLKWTPAIEMKQNQTFFDRTYLNLIQHLFLSTNIRNFNGFQNRSFALFFPKLNPNNGNETKSVISLWDIFKSDFYNWHFSISLQKWHKKLNWNKIIQDTWKSEWLLSFLKRFI